MVQPRKEQIKNLKTRHALVSFSPTPGDAYTDISDATINSYVISNTYGGIQEDVQIVVDGDPTTPKPFAPTPGFQFTVDVGLGAGTVTLAATDTTASRVANKINAAAGGAVASNEEGVIRVVSAGFGDGQTVTLTDINFGALASVGLTPGTYTGGTEAPVRGVITKSADIRGGFVPIKDQRGKNIVTDTSAIHSIEEGFGFTTRRAYIPGGAPVHGRLGRTPDNLQYRLSYYAQMPTEPEIITFNSSFASLGIGDFITLVLNYKIKIHAGIATPSIGPFVINFGAGPWTRDLVVDEINTEFANAASTSGGNARVVGAIPQPFSFETGATMQISIDGGPFIPVSFTPALHKSATDVVNRINGILGPGVASVVTNGNNNYVQISSLNSDGRTSSVEIRNQTTNDPLKTLGLRPGLYRGLFIADHYGAEEIRLFGLGRGSDCNLQITALGVSTGTRLGLSTGTYAGSDLGEVKVDFPELDFVDSAEIHSAKALFPEVLEYGEVDLAVESIVEEFNVKVLDNQWGNGTDLIVDGYGATFPGAPSRGVKDAGKPVMVNPFGGVNLGLTGGITAHIESILGKFVVGDLAPYVERVDKIAISYIETPTPPNPTAENDQLFFDVDPDGSFAPGNREYVFQIEGGTGAVWRLTENTPIPTMLHEFRLAGASVIRNATTFLSFADIQTRNSGSITGGVEYVNLSDGYTRYLKRFNVESSGDPIPHSIFSKANSIWTCTVGDGTNNRGDFDGTGAIQDAIAYWVANVGGDGFRIRCKAGTYEMNLANGGITIPTNVYAIIEGESKETVEIRHTQSGVSVTIGDDSTLDLRDLALVRAIAEPPPPSDTNIWMNNGAVLKANNVDFQYFYPTVAYSGEWDLKNCSFRSRYGACLDIRVTGPGSTTGPFKARDCSFTLDVTDIPAVRIRDIGVTDITVIKGLLFENCQFNLEGATDDAAGNFTGNAGVLSLVPGSTGLCTLEDVTWKDCEVNAQRGDNHTLLYLRTSDGVNEITVDRLSIIGGNWNVGPQTAAGLFSPFYIGGDTNAVFNSYVNHVVIQDVVMGYTGTISSNYGTFTAETDGGFFGPLDWAAFFINPYRSIKIHNWRFPTSTVRSGAGDLLVIMGPSGVPYGGKWDIRGIYFDYDSWVDTTGFGTPEQRIQFRNLATYNSSGSIDQVIVNFPPLSNAAALKGIIKPMAAGRMTLRECEVNGHSPPYFTRGAFFLDGDEDAAGYSGLTMINCKATENAGNGLDWRDNVSAAEDIKVTQCIFTNNVKNGLTPPADWDSGHGICFYATGTAKLRDCVFTDNICSNNATYGMWIAPFGTGFGPGHGNEVIISNNIIRNNSTVDATQLLIGDISAGGGGHGSRYGHDARMTVFGNDCGGQGGVTWGAITVATDVGLTDPDYIYGIEIILGIGGAPFNANTGRGWFGTSPYRCFYNFAILSWITG